MSVTEVKVREFGFVKLRDHMGSDASIESSARTSYDSVSTRSTSDTNTLLRYLLRNYHTTPFEMAVIVFHIKMPIFVARQIMRHRAATYNELSGRYSVMPDDNFEYQLGEINAQSQTNKQGRDEAAHPTLEPLWIKWVKRLDRIARKVYHKGIDGDIAREQARVCLPVSTYTEVVVKMDLHNLMHFLKLRMDTHAQLETREFANAMYEIAKGLYPLTIAAFDDYRLGAKSMSALETKMLTFVFEGVHLGYGQGDIIESLTKKAPELGVTKRELGEFLAYITPLLPK